MGFIEPFEKPGASIALVPQVRSGAERFCSEAR
jgi:hypothetical protein